MEEEEDELALLLTQPELPYGSIDRCLVGCGEEEEEEEEGDWIGLD